MHERYQNRSRYFGEQEYTTARYVIPFLGQAASVGPGFQVLEIGCGLGGNLKPFLDLGCTVTGVDLNPTYISTARELLKEYADSGRMQLICRDMYQCNPEELGEFDLIIMKDVIEHIHDQERFMGFVRKFLKTGGRFFLAFPPWQMPFGGHQQVCDNRVFARVPYIHLLPGPLYRLLLAMSGEKRQKIEDLLEIRSTGISIERFRRAVHGAGYSVETERFFLVNPNYEIKFGLRPREQAKVISSIFYLRNFVTTCCYYLLKKNH